LITVNLRASNCARLGERMARLLRVEYMPDAKGCAFVLELRDPFYPLSVVCKDDSLIAVVLGRHLDGCRRALCDRVISLCFGR
jgi:hypothetical protein